MTEHARIRRGLTEFLIIVLGVGTALTADRFRKSYSDRALEREYTARLVDELTRGRVRIVYHQGRVDSAVTAIDTLLHARDRTRDTATLSRLAVRAANYEYNPAGIVHDLTYRELLATGSLGLLRDLETRNAITTYYRLAYRAGEVAVETNERTREFANRVRAATGEAPSRLTDGSARLTEDDRRRLVALFVASEDMDDELRLLRSRLIDRFVWNGRLLAGTDSLLKTINAN
jgi:hypothetical protein